MNLKKALTRVRQAQRLNVHGVDYAWLYVGESGEAFVEYKSGDRYVRSGKETRIFKFKSAAFETTRFQIDLHTLTRGVRYESERLAKVMGDYYTIGIVNYDLN